MKKVYFLSSCDTCKRIIKENNLKEHFEFQDIKKEHIDATSLEWLMSKVDDVKDLFNKRAQKYRKLEQKIEDLSSEEVKALILSEYTFLKRPIIINGEEVFVGNSKKVIEQMKSSLS